MMNKEYVSWHDVYHYIDELSNWIKSKNIQLTGVYGLPRGGLPLAVMLSHKLSLPFLGAPCDGCLVIDDIADSGRSLIHYTTNDTQENKYYISTMFFDARSCVTPDFYSYKKDGRWIIFPWEVI